MRKLGITIIMALALTSCSAAVRPLPTTRHAETQWIVRDSIVFEAIAFLNALSGDPLVGAHYLADTRHFQPMLTAEVEQALADLAIFRQEKRHGNLSGFLLPFFLAGKVESLDDLIALSEDPAPIRKALQAYDRSLVEINVYYGDPGWKLFEETLPSLQTVFRFLKEADFAGYWQSQHRADVGEEIRRIEAAVSGQNIIPAVEARLGFGLPSDQVAIYLVHFLWPYGHHLIGTSFATIPEDSDEGVIRTTIHELLHNPFNNTDPDFWNAINTLKEDPFLSQVFAQRDPKYGYNNWPDYVAEDSVRALEQHIEEDLGLGKRWNWNEDGGMHALSAVLCELMEQQGFPQQSESYQDFVIRMVKEGKLAVGETESLYQAHIDRHSKP